MVSYYAKGYVKGTKGYVKGCTHSGLARTSLAMQLGLDSWIMSGGGRDKPLGADHVARAWMRAVMTSMVLGSRPLNTMANSFAPIINDKKPLAPVFSSVPTSDDQVRAELLRIGEPESLAGEGKAERRDRLMRIAGELKPTLLNAESEADETDGSSGAEDDEFYTPGSEELLDARKRILEFLIGRAAARNSRQRAHASGLDFTKVLRHRRGICQSISAYELLGSYNVQGNTRAVSCVRIHACEKITACSSWDGGIYIFKDCHSRDLKQVSRLAPGYHLEKTTFLWNATNDAVLMSGCGDGTINIWTVDPEAKEMSPTFTRRKAHDGRIAQVACHPSGGYFCTTSFDQVWKLWDTQRPEKELLEQEGHVREVFACSFHPDGSLLGTGGLDGLCRVWDLRSGRAIASLQGHLQGIFSMDWSPNGHQLATGSGDNSIKIWDLRKPERELFTIPAHSKLVSDVHFVRGTDASKLAQPVMDENDQNPLVLDICGTLLVSASYDGTVKVWSSDNWVLAKTLRGHTDKVMSCDISMSGEIIVSSGWDRTVRTWGAV